MGRAAGTVASCTATGRRCRRSGACWGTVRRCSSRTPRARIVPAVRAFCESRGEDVWLREGGMLEVSAGESEDAGVERAIEAVTALGVDEEAMLLDTAEVRRRCDSPRFRSGVIFRDGATVQPARLVLALRRAAIASGVQVFEHTPVTARPRGLADGARDARAASSGRARSCSR